MRLNTIMPWLSLGFTASPGHSFAELVLDGGLRDRRAMHSLVPVGTYEDESPELPLPSERPPWQPIDVPAREPFDVPVRSPADVPAREPHDVPPPPAEPPFPRQPQPPMPPERKPEAKLKSWRKRPGGRERKNPGSA
jgi:hypothetical protein